MAAEGAYDLIILRRDDARHDGARDPPQDQGGAPHDARHHGDQERGGEHHGQGRRLEDRRLPHQTRQPQSGAALDQEERAPAAARHRADHGRLPVGIRAYLLVAADGRDLFGLVLALPQAHQLGGRAFGIHRPGHQGGAHLPEDRGEPGILQVRTPQLLQLDQQALGRHPRDVTHAHAHQHLPGGGREPEDHAAADRQLPLRPVAVDLLAAAGLLRRGARRFLLRPSSPRQRNTPAMPSSPA